MKIDKLAMGQAYKEMANINLNIAKEDFHLEQEGMKYYEMDSQESKNRTKAN